MENNHMATICLEGSTSVFQLEELKARPSTKDARLNGNKYKFNIT